MVLYCRRIHSGFFYHLYFLFNLKRAVKIMLSFGRKMCLSLCPQSGRNYKPCKLLLEILDREKLKGKVDVFKGKTCPGGMLLIGCSFHRKSPAVASLRALGFSPVNKFSPHWSPLLCLPRNAPLFGML